MATIGSIAVAFEADIKGLESGIEDIIDLFDDLSEAVDSIAEKLSGISQRSISLRVDTSDITRATQEIETLRSAAEASQPVVKPKADSSDVRVATTAVEDLSTAIEQASGKSVSVNSSEAEQAFSRTGLFAREFAGIVSGAVSASLNGVADTFQGVASAARGIDTALVSVAEGFQNVRTSADATIVAVGRTLDSFDSSESLIKAATLALGGYATVSAAVAGSAAAATTAVSSLAGAMVGSAVNTVTYAAVMAAARAATVGMSEEARQYAERYADMGAQVAAGSAQIAATAATFRFISTSIRSSATAGGFFSRVFTGLGNAATAAGSRISGVVNALGPLYAGFQVLSASAKNAEMSVGQLQAATARVVATSVAFSAVGGAFTAASRGASIMSGAVSAAARAFPAITAASIAAAVATGRLSHELEELSLQAQQVDQMASRFGAPRAEIEKLRLAASNTGVSLGQLAKGQQNFFTSLSKIKTGQMNVENVREAKLAFDALDISMSNLKNARPDEVFKMVAEKLSEVEDPAKRTQIAFDLFGKQGANILPALKEFGEISADFDRLGGSIAQVDFERLLLLENSFDRQKAAAANLRSALLVPFVELQKAFNNLSADISGGLASALSPIATLLANITKPFAVVIEIAGRMINTLLRIVGAAARIAVAFSSATGIAVVFQLLQQVFNQLWSTVEGLTKSIEAFANGVSAALTPTVSAFVFVGEKATQLLNIFSKFLGLGDVFGQTTSSLIALGVAFVAVTSGAKIFAAVMKTSAGVAIKSALTTAAAWAGAGVAIVASLAGAAVVAIGVYIASVLSALATTIASSVAMHVAWLFALGPIGLLIGGVELIGASLVGLYALGSGIVDFFSGWGEGKEKIDATTASVDELAAAAQESQSQGSESGFLKDMEALALAAGYSQEEIDATKQSMQEYATSAATAVAAGMSTMTDAVGESLGYSQEQIDDFKQRVSTLGADLAAFVGVSVEPGPSMEEMKQAVTEARDGIGDLTIRAAQFGSAGEEAASAAQKSFNELQQAFADGDITLEQFKEESEKVREKLEENLDVLANDSPEVTLKKNLELYKQLGDAAKQAGKEMRDAMADVKIGDKFFPRSEEVKAKAQEFQDQYAAALEAIKKKQQAGDFGRELTAKKKQNEEDLAAGRITKEQFEAVKLRLDSTTAQEEAQKAAEDAKRTFERGMSSLDLSFADDIRKRLENAFKSPVDKFAEELKKVRENLDLSDDEKAQAERMLRKEAREGIIGKTATEKFDERGRDIRQAQEAGLINSNEAMIEAAKNADELANALGLPVDPANAMKASTLQLIEAFSKGKISAEELAKGLAASRRAFLESLGIKEKPGEADRRQLDELTKRRGKPLSEGGITEDEFQRGRQAIENSIVGQSASDRIREQRERINQGMASGAVSDARGQAALRGLDRDRKQAAGLELTAGEQMQAGVDKINDAFGVAGKSMTEIQATLSPKEFAEYQEALRKNTDAVKQSLGIEKTGAEQLAESRKKLDQAVKDGVITEQEKNKALKKQRDSLLSSLGISKSPAQDFEDAVERIKENAAALTPGEIAKGLKEAKDKLLSSLGIDKSPSQAAQESLRNLREAFVKGKISAEEFAKGSQKAKETLLQALGIPLDPVTQLKQRMDDLNEAFDSGQITQEEFSRGQEEARRSMLPGGEAESPVKKFQRDIEAVNRAVEAGLISDEDGSERRRNLQAQLQEDLKPALDNLKPDRRAIDSSDTRSKAGVDTFFRILRGRDDPSLKAQLEIARNTRLLAEVASEPEAAPLIAPLPAR